MKMKMHTETKTMIVKSSKKWANWAFWAQTSTDTTVRA